MNAVIQRKTGKLLGWCELPKFWGERGYTVPIRTGCLFVKIKKIWLDGIYQYKNGMTGGPHIPMLTTANHSHIDFRYKFSQADLKKKIEDIRPSVIAYGYRDAGILPNFKRIWEEKK